MNLIPGCELSGRSVFYLLSGEFDNKYGPTISCQYPRDIPGFGSVSGDRDIDSASSLASLLIPTNAEHRTLSAPDSNVFTLFLNQHSRNYQLLPSFGMVTMETDVKDPLRLNFVNVVKTLRDENNSRGAKIRSIALGTTLGNVEALKPFLTEALVHIMHASDVNEIKEVLMSCFQALNGLDLCTVETSLHKNPIQQTLCSVRRKSLLQRLLSDDTQLGRDILKILDLGSGDKFGNKIELKKGKLLLHFKHSSVQSPFENLIQKPIEMSLFSYTASHIKIGNLLVFRFLQKLIPALAKLSSSDYSFRIIVNSHKLPKEQICQFVVTLSQLMGCFSEAEGTQYYDGANVLILPYAEVSMIKSIKEFFTTCDVANLFTIIGTANPIFRHHKYLWDYYYDIDEDVLEASSDNVVNNQNSLWDSNLLKKLLPKSINDAASLHAVEFDRMGLLAAFVSLINDLKPNEENILSTLRKINVLQIQSQLREFRVDETSLCSRYVTGFRDFVKFNHLFTQESLTVIQQFSNLDHLISNLYDAAQSLRRRQELLSQLLDLLNEVISFIEKSQERLTIFLSIALDYSPFQSLSEGNLIVRDFSTTNLRHEVAETLKKNKSWISVIDNSDTRGLFETFAKERALDLLSMTLLLNSDIHKTRVTKSTNLDGASVDSLSISSSSSGNSNVETRRPRSMSLKWIKSLHLHKSSDNFVEESTTPWLDTSSVSSSPGRFTSTKSSNAESMSSLSSISSSSSRKVSYKSFRQKTENIKRLATEIILRIKSHPIGTFLINEEMSSFGQTLFQVSEVEFMPSS
ncbi:hypothetical protein HG536_0F02580 [Torulaspora globosa]|uniref:Arf3-interacting protein 1 N-terminal domain-containing protein n=1 Tax=Torulaspora globosa TaxID=48254 RepID=A0A7G3ZK97_9SACH|nr:uncharacterized protein HG536_0F02580 [Torulaspora globosa]QLL33933.1 hypothetical protein HG536_0F02580 [Torulaspora globosa]